MTLQLISATGKVGQLTTETLPRMGETVILRIAGTHRPVAFTVTGIFYGPVNHGPLLLVERTTTPPCVDNYFEAFLSQG